MENLLKIELTPIEARVIGCLIEKEVTTPEQYPLSLNALVSACNQKSNRDPVMDVDEGSVQDALDTLSKRYLVSSRSGFGSRVPKYHHRFCNTEFGDLKFSEQELAIVCLLLLRGAQTPGELRTRSNRLCQFSDVRVVETVLTELQNREDGSCVAKLSREPGRRESRYVQLFCSQLSDDQTLCTETSEEASAMGAASLVVNAAEDADRLTQIEAHLDELKQTVAALTARLDSLTSDRVSGDPDDEP